MVLRGRCGGGRGYTSTATVAVLPEAKDAAMAEERKNQAGSGDRSERIRTYNFPQGRVTDHRIALTVHSLPQVLEEELDPVLDALIADDQAARLPALEEELG